MVDDKKTDVSVEDTVQKQTETNEMDMKIQQLKEENDLLKKENGDNKEKAEVAEAKLATALSQYVRLQADFDNFRRRTRENEAKAEDKVKAKVLKEFLPLVDNFEMVLAQVEKSDAGEAFIKGMELLLKQFISFLKDFEVTEIESLGKPFDPYYHEAVMQITSDEWEDDTVSMVMKKGYMYKDEVLRPASVQVSHKP